MSLDDIQAYLFGDHMNDKGGKPTLPGTELMLVVLDRLKSALVCARHIKAVNNFMVMNINRSIEYTKACNGLALAAKLETVEVAEVVNMPIICMQEVQSGGSSVLPIHLSPLPLELASHMITDRLWLQENLLCLLSNAVKYSSKGAISVHVRLSKDEEELANRSGLVQYEVGCILSTIEIIREPYRVALFQQFVNYAMEVTTWLSPKLNNVSPYSSIASDVYNNDNELCDDLELGINDGENNGVEIQDRLVATPPCGINADRDFVVFEIEDTGIGVSEGKKQILFKPFQQAQRLAGGTGLGLYSLANRMRALKGYYGVRERDDGQSGSVFWFAIPYKPDLSNYDKDEPNNDESGSGLEKKADVIWTNTDDEWKPNSHLSQYGWM